MKVSWALLILLLAAAWNGSQGMSCEYQQGRSPPLSCPSSSSGGFHSRRIPEFRIQGYQHTAPSCTHRAVLVELLKGMVCVDPKQRWFQEYLRKQKKMST
ncbi:CCL13 protein, partial [Alaudala cheleensis]|nr:CCL13 protein [Alaudala cheleensis]